MYELLVIVLVIFCLYGVISIRNHNERFSSIVSPITDPIKEVAYYNRPDRDHNYIDLPFRQEPVESQVFCPPQTLYNTSCYPHPLKDRVYSDSLSGPYTVPLRMAESAPPINTPPIW